MWLNIAFEKVFNCNTRIAINAFCPEEQVLMLAKLGETKNNLKDLTETKQGNKGVWSKQLCICWKLYPQFKVCLCEHVPNIRKKAKGGGLKKKSVFNQWGMQLSNTQLAYLLIMQPDWRFWFWVLPGGKEHGWLTCQAQMCLVSSWAGLVHWVFRVKSSPAKNIRALSWYSLKPCFDMKKKEGGKKQGKKNKTKESQFMV